MVDPVRIGDNPAAGCLAEHFGQADNRKQIAGDDVSQHLARADRRQLVDIGDNEQRRRVGHRAVYHMIAEAEARDCGGEPGTWQIADHGGWSLRASVTGCSTRGGGICWKDRSAERWAAAS